MYIYIYGQISHAEELNIDPFSSTNSENITLLQDLRIKSNGLFKEGIFCKLNTVYIYIIYI